METAIVPSSPAQELSLPGRSIDLKAVFLGGIFLLLLLTALREAGVIVIPVVLAFVLKLVLQPLLRSLVALHLPRTVASGLILVALISAVIMLGSMLSGPASSWGAKLPEAVPQLQERLRFLTNPMVKTEKMLVQADTLTGTSPKVASLVMPGTRLSDRIFTATQLMVSGLLTTMLLLFFLLAAGDTFLRRLVEVLPNFRNKRQAVEISQKIETDISGYLLTISVINMSVGILSGLIMWAYHVEDPLLWGTLAFLLNYVPILGPIATIAMFLFVGLMAINHFWMALMPAILYALIRFAEALFVTPMLVARRFTLNPVLVIFALIFWYWMWGLPGAILAMPMLAMTKIICDRIPSLAAFGHFLEG